MSLWKQDGQSLACDIAGERELRRTNSHPCMRMSKGKLLNQVSFLFSLNTTHVCTSRLSFFATICALLDLEHDEPGSPVLENMHKNYSFWGFVSGLVGEPGEVLLWELWKSEFVSGTRPNTIVGEMRSELSGGGVRNEVCQPAPHLRSKTHVPCWRGRGQVVFLELCGKLVLPRGDQQAAFTARCLVVSLGPP